MISVDPIAVGINIISFLILVWVLNLVLYRPIRQILKKRKEKISGLGQGIGDTLRSVEEKSLSHETGLREARVRGLKEKELLVKTAAEEEKSILAQIAAKNQEHLAEVSARISKDTTVVKAALLEEVDVFAEIICRKILGRTVS